MPILPMALSLAMGYRLCYTVYTRSSAVLVQRSAKCQVPSASVYGCVTSAERQTLAGPRTRGTDSWLDDTDKNVGPDLPLLFKLHEIWSVDS